MTTLYGVVFDFGLGMTNPAEAKYLLESGSAAEIYPFASELSAYHYLRVNYVNRGLSKLHSLIPVPDFDGFYKYKYYCHTSYAKDGRPSFFAVYNDQAYGIIDTTETASNSLFSANNAFCLQEFESKEEAFNKIYMYYAAKGGIQLPYCNGAPLPVVPNVMELNVFYPSPLPNFFREHLRLPENLRCLGPSSYENQDFYNCILLK